MNKGHKPGGRPGRVGLDEIIDAALAIGLDQVSMRAVARRLGVGASTLYYHVESVEQLRALTGYRLLERLKLELDPTDWERTVTTAARALRALLERAPGLAETAISDPNWGDPTLRLNEQACRLLADAGFSPADAWLGTRAVADFVEAFVIRARAHASAGHSDLDTAGRSNRDYPNMSAASAALGDAAPERRFEFGLDCLLRGLRSLRAGDN
ncbi:MAG: TetR/AcrR family transcriptional regulator C-terminal domain-containing protein [Nannocystaceae bacterium]|nr:TetR/AcrR family transcriptional regulator C-terminal domain-containing protein [Nannocystaceae bacterium]